MDRQVDESSGRAVSSDQVSLYGTVSGSAILTVSIY